MQIIQTKIGDIKPYTNNAKQHPEGQVLLISESIKRFGFVNPIVVDKANIIIAGHGRYLGAQKLGLQEVPVVRVEDLSEEEVNALRLADNQLNAMSGNDMQMVIEELKTLPDDLIELTGFDKDLLVEDGEHDDDVPDTPEEPLSKIGDVYQLGKHTLMCGDSTSIEHLKQLMNGVEADMVFTDPPYNVNIEGKGENTSNKILNDNMSDQEFDTFLDAVFKRFKENSKVGAPWYVFHSPTTQDQFKKWIEEAGWKVKTQLIWNKPNAGMGMNEYRAKHEPFFYCVNRETPFYGNRTGTSVWDFHKSEDELVKWAKRQLRAEREGVATVWTMKREPVGDYVHPTQKPVELIGYALHNSSKSGDTVLDLFGGSGATLIACEKYDRRCRTMELDPKYVDVIVERYCNFVGNNEIIKNGEQIVWKENE